MSIARPGGPRTLPLDEDAARVYLATLRALLSVSHAGAQFPDVRRLDAFLSFLGPAGPGEARALLDVERASGFPAMHELVRLRALREVAREALGSKRKGALLGGFPRALAAADLAPVSEVSARLVERKGRRSRFVVVRDLLDVHGGGFVRFTFRIAQEGASHLELERKDLTRVSERFRAELERCSASDAEVALLLLSELPGLTVEDVVRGQLGPFCPPAPSEGPIAAALSGCPGNALLHLTLERAGPGVAADRCPDPFARLYRDGLSPAARTAAEARAKLLGYRVSKERRLCCTAGLVQPLKESLAAAGTPLVVRSR